MKIGLISDTHSYFDPQLRSYFSDCDEIWHAGDFGTLKVAEQLEKIAPLRGVYGNIDGQDIRQEYPLHLRFKCEGIDVWMTHIGGSPGRYCLPIRKERCRCPRFPLRLLAGATQCVPLLPRWFSKGNAPAVHPLQC